MTIIVFRYFDFKGTKSWINHAWNSPATTDCNWGPNSALDLKFDEKRPEFFWKNLGSVFFNFYSQGMVWSQMAICCCAINLHVIFFTKSNFIWPTPTQNRLETPRFIYCLKAYTVSEKCTSQNFLLGPSGLGNSPSKSLETNLAKYIRGSNLIIPPKPPVSRTK